ncbi:MAG: hypothetical protein J7L07_02155 [Candidatus Odinarchaeota archaeon]|nr:hypothetical protein [Candidatus Odinarchaeota archaeon]
MRSRDLVYAFYENCSYDHLPLHFESIEKSHETKLGDVLLVTDGFLYGVIDFTMVGYFVGVRVKVYLDGLRD